MEDEFNLEIADSPLERQVKPLETYVVRERVGYPEAVAASQGHRAHLFSGGLRKPRFEDVGYVAWRKVYDAFWCMEGSYVCDFLRQQNYRIPVAPDVISLKVGENVYLAERERDGSSLVSLDVVEKCNVATVHRLYINATTGTEDPSPMQLGVEGRNPISSISDHVASGREGPGDVVVQPLKVSVQEALERFEAMLFARPKDAARILVERMAISPSVVYVARFQVLFRNQRDGVERELSVHGVTGAVTW